MTDRLLLTRRKILTAGTVLLMAMSASTRLRWIADRFGGERLTVANLLHDCFAIRTIGARYLSDHADENDPAILAQWLPEGCATPDCADVGALRRNISARCSEDFAASDTVIIDGWIVARTEARLCALAMLTT